MKKKASKFLKDQLHEACEYLISGLIVLNALILGSAAVVMGIDLGLKIVGLY